nr:unnamed protein product [Callosobruchus chinensis]
MLTLRYLATGDSYTICQ